MIKANNLNKYYNKNKNNEIHVINDTSLVLPDKGLVVLRGASGSGKTTLLNVLGGLDKAKGQLAYDDLVLDRYNMRKIDKYRNKHIGYVFQNYNLLLEYTVYENLDLALSLYDVYDKEEKDRRIDYALDAVGMLKYKRKSANALSGGQQQRVSIARALVKDSKIIMCDEPTGNLDSKNTIEVMSILKQLSKDKLVLLVTHDQNMANAFADIIIDIVDGVVSSVFENTKASTLSTEDKDTIYLCDLEKKETNIDNVNINYYSDNPKGLQVNINVVEKNGRIYLDIDRKVEVIGVNTKINIINDRYLPEQLNELNEKSFNIDYKEDVKDNKVKMKRSFGMLVKAFKRFRGGKLKSKLFHLSFLLFGFVIALILADLSYINYTDYSQYIYEVEDNVVEINKGYKNINDDDIYKIITNSETLGLSRRSFEYYYNISGIESFNNTYSYIYSNTSIINIDFNEHGSLITGSVPKEGEILITETLAKNIIKKINEANISDYRDLLNRKIAFSRDFSYKISGVCKGSLSGSYVNTIDYYKGRNEFNNYFDLLDKVEFYTLEEYNKVNLPLTNYIEGDVLVDSSILQVLGGSKELTSYNFEDNIIVFTNEEAVNKFYKSIYPETIKLFPTSVSNINLSSGKEPSNYDEVLANDLYFKEGDTFITSIGSYKVVGTYSGAYNNFNAYTTRIGADLYYLYSNISSEFSYLGDTDNFKQQFLGINIIVKDVSKAIEEFGDEYNIFDYQKSVMAGIKSSDIKSKNSMIVTLTVIVVIMIISMFLINRSLMLNNIYTIGVYRALGASRLRISKIFLTDSFILTTFTTVIGYTLTITFISLVVSKYSNFDIKGLYILFGYALIYLINILSSMLPIGLLLLKTPSEILSKYDI